MGLLRGIVQSSPPFYVSCVPDCDYEAEARDEGTLVETMTAHMWEEHRLPVDPLDVREMVRPTHRISRRETNASTSAETHVSSRS
jgi:predicted small metal-binding protein